MQETPLETRVYDAQSRGDRVHISAWTSDGRYALVICGDNAYVAHADTVNGIGRWECSIAHLRTFADVYGARFPHTTRPDQEG